MCQIYINPSLILLKEIKQKKLLFSAIRKYIVFFCHLYGPLKQCPQNSLSVCLFECMSASHTFRNMKYR